MRELPKIALARLKAKPDAPKSASPSPGPDVFQGAGHPDANLLAAFVEKTLTERERTQVLDHLIQCAGCREVAALTLPAEIAAAAPVPVRARRRWTSWPMLRWGAMAAVLGALTVVVVLHPDLRNRHPEISKLTPPAPAGNIASAPQSVPAPPLGQPSAETAQAKAQQELRKSVSEMAAMKKASGPQGALALDDRVARAQAKQQVTLMAPSRPPAAVKAENAPAANLERDEGKGGKALSAGALSAPAPPPAPAAPAAAEELARADIQSQAEPGTYRATAQSVAVTGGNPAAGAAGATAAKAAPRAPSPATLHMVAGAPMDEMQASRKDKEFGAALPATLWTVSSNGKVQHSTDGGKTFEQVLVAHGIMFRATAAVGNDVWAGGTGGALFHSTDGGISWNRSGINVEGSAVTETITGIQMRDPQHLTVTTSSGAQWVSEDGGQHWRNQP